MKFIVILSVLTVFTATVKNEIIVNDIRSSESFTRYTDLAIYMVKSFISPITNTLVITEKCEFVCRGENKYQTAILTNILQGISDDLAIQLFLGHYNDRLWDYNLFIIDSWDAFMTLRYTFPTTDQERYFNFFILLTWSPNEIERYVTMDKIFTSSKQFNVKNVVIMSYSSDKEYIGFYTYDMFTGYYCQGSVYVLEINRFENGQLKKPMLFPKYTSNFHGCRLKITAHILAPILMFNGDTDNETHLMEMNRVTGVEGDILKVISEALNFKYILRFPKASEHVINTADNSIGCFSDLEQNRAQVAVGAFSTMIVNGEKLSRSYVYHSTPYVFVVRSGLCFGPFKQLFNPLCPETWLLLLIIFIVLMSFTKIVQKYPVMRSFIFGSKNQHPFRSIFVIFLGNPIPTYLVPRRNFARFLLAAWLLLSFEIRNGYQGKMFDSLRFSKKIPVPETISQLIEQDYTLLSRSYKEFYPANKTIIMSNVTQRLDYLQNNDLRLTTAIFLDTLAYYNYINSDKSTLTYVDEAILTYQFTMYFQKHSMLRFSFDRKLKILSDAGITSYIAKKHIRKGYQAMNPQSQFVSKLANANLQGLYLVNIVLCSISLLIFILELLTTKSKILRKIMDELNLL